MGKSTRQSNNNNKTIPRKVDQLVIVADLHFVNASPDYVFVAAYRVISIV